MMDKKTEYLKSLYKVGPAFGDINYKSGSFSSLSKCVGRSDHGSFSNTSRYRYLILIA